MTLYSAIIDIGTPLPLPSLHSIVIPDQLHVFRISCFTVLEVFDLFFFWSMGGGGGGGGDLGRGRGRGCLIVGRSYQLSVITISVIHVHVHVHVVAH